MSTSGTYNLQVDVCRVVGRKFTGVGKPHDKSADDDGKPVNDSIVFVRMNMSKSSFIALKLQECVGSTSYV